MTDSPNLTDTSFKFLSGAKLLRKVKISSNQNLTDMAVKFLTKHCTELRYVALTDCEKISDISLKCLAMCKNLTVLNLADCIRISDNGVKYLGEGACVQKLRELNLTNCIRIGSASIGALSKK
jgi:F-box/leucine-rich repeat protein 13